MNYKVPTLLIGILLVLLGIVYVAPRAPHSSTALPSVPTGVVSDSLTTDKSSSTPSVTVSTSSTPLRRTSKTTTVPKTSTTPKQEVISRLPSHTASVTIETTISNPGALLIERSSLSSSTTPEPPQSSEELSFRGILEIVNVERTKQGLSPLVYNPTLTVIAEVKAMDMIKRQYFAHKSPDGIDVSGLADQYHYDYLNIGENLAMGDFVSDLDVMTGWMNSPGHRANILNPKYTEIGISAIKGMHEGRLVWYAVQEFGRPARLCPKPDTTLSSQISSYESQLDSMERTLSAIKEELNAGGLDRASYNTKADEYNALVETYNALIVVTKKAISEYNAEVEGYNTCIGA